jgi:hypothetical protein
VGVDMREAVLFAIDTSSASLLLSIFDWPMIRKIGLKFCGTRHR